MAGPLLIAPEYRPGPRFRATRSTPDRNVRLSQWAARRRPQNLDRYGDGAGAGTIVAGNGQLPLSYGGQFGTASSGGG